MTSSGKGSGLVVEMGFRVRYADTDQMGRAYYAAYFVWFEAARGALCRVLGFSYSDLEEAGVFLPVLRTTCRYLRPLVYEEKAWVAVRLVDCRSRSLLFSYEILTEEGHRAAEGDTYHGFLDRSGRLVRCPSPFRERMRQVVVNPAGGRPVRRIRLSETDDAQEAWRMGS